MIKNGKGERKQYSRERGRKVAPGERRDSCKTEINYRTEWRTPEGCETYFLAPFLSEWAEGSGGGSRQIRWEEGGEGKKEKEEEKEKKTEFL